MFRSQFPVTLFWRGGGGEHVMCGTLFLVICTAILWLLLGGLAIKMGTNHIAPPDVCALIYEST